RILQPRAIVAVAFGPSMGPRSVGLTAWFVRVVLTRVLIVRRRGIHGGGRGAVRVRVVWRVLSNGAGSRVAPVIVILGLVAGVGSFLYQKANLQIGDLDPGAPELHGDSRYNLDNDFIISNYSTSSDILVVMVETPLEMCSAYKTMEAIDQL